MGIYMRPLSLQAPLTNHELNRLSKEIDYLEKKIMRKNASEKTVIKAEAELDQIISYIEESLNLVYKRNFLEIVNIIHSS